MAEQDLKSAAFAALDPAQMAALASCQLATLKRYQDGQKLFDVGDRDLKFLVVKTGSIEIVDESGDKPRTVAILGPGAFTGEVAQLNGGPSIVSGIARGDTEVYEVSPSALKRLLNDHPDIGDTILHAFIARRQLVRESGEFVGLRVIGSRYSQDTFRIRDFLARNRVPFTWFDLEADPQVKQLVERFGVTEADTPVVAWGRKLLLRNPSTRELAEALGLFRPVEQTVYDLVIVGAGPAGLAAAVYGASEGLTTVLLERSGPGGQAGRSMRIENYLGFPTGISGAELAERAVVQANRFGARLPVGTQVTSLTFENMYSVVHLERGERITAKCLLIATGADYRMLNVDGCSRLEGCGVYYAATPNEALMCQESDVVVVGGGNSAGQAAVYLAQHVLKVHMVVRSDSLHKNMSSYLARRIESMPQIEVLLNTEVQRLVGDNFLTAVEIANKQTGEIRTIPSQALFSFIGAVPRTDWLPREIERDSKDFVKTGTAVTESTGGAARRQPYLLETSRFGVFAAGDVRAGSIKRVASAVGEGAMVVQFVHEVLKTM